MDDAPRFLPDDAEVVIVEVIIVAGKVFIAHQAFTFVVLQFDEKPPFAHARNQALKHTPDFVLQIFSLLVFDGLAFHVFGLLFHFAGMDAHVLVVFLVSRALTLNEIPFNQAMHHQVGIAADGGGEVGVVVE